MANLLPSSPGLHPGPSSPWIPLLPSVTSAGAASVPGPLLLPGRVLTPSQWLFRAGTPSRPRAAGAQGHRRCPCVTWGALASPEQTSPESLSSLPRDLRGETDPLISGSWPEWGLCWSSSAACSPGELACTSALVRRAGRTWHVQVCCCWDRSSAVGWAAGTWPWAPGWRQKPRPGEELPVGLLCQAPGVRLGKERAAPFRPGPCAWGCPPWSR